MNTPRFNATLVTKTLRVRLMYCARLVLVVLVGLLTLVPAQAYAVASTPRTAGPAVSTGTRQATTDTHTQREGTTVPLVSDDAQPIAPLSASFAPTTTQTFTGTASVRAFEGKTAGIGTSPIAARSRHTATRLVNGKVLIIGGQNNGTALASAEVYEPTARVFSATGSLLQARSYHTATLLPNGTVLIIGGRSGTDELNSAEVYNPATGTFAATGSMTEARSDHTATLLPDGTVLVVGGDGTGGVLASAEVYDPATGSFAATGSVSETRSGHTATLLPNGTVLVVGGHGPTNEIDRHSAEVYDPTTGSFTATGSLVAGRSWHTATPLPNGKVLVVGGYGDNNVYARGEANAEVYDPTTGMFTAAGSLLYARYHHTATLLSNGKILITGGEDNGPDPSIDEVYDPATGTFASTYAAYPDSGQTATLLLNGKVLIVSGEYAIAAVYDLATGTSTATTEGTDLTARAGHTATLLTDGKVLVVGGSNYDYYSNRSGGTLTSAVLYDPVTNTLAATGSMLEPRIYHTATLLPNGTVLIVGGYNGSSTLASAEIYDPGTGTFAATGSPLQVRSGHTATLLDDGKVLIVDGTTSAEIYDPDSGTFAATGSLIQARGGHTATLLPNGKVLVAGGGSTSTVRVTAELYDPATSTFTATGSMAYPHVDHEAVLLQDGTVLIVGGRSRTVLGSAEIYDPVSGTFALTGMLSNARANGHTATLMADGTVLVVAGYEGEPMEYAAVDVYDPITKQFSSVGWAGDRVDHTTTLLLDGTVLIVGGRDQEGELYEDASRSRVTVTNTFSGTLTVPVGWNTPTTAIITFTGSTTGTMLTDGSLNGGPWVPAQPNQPVVTTLPRTADGRDVPVTLRLRDADGVEATVVRGTIDIDTVAPTSTTSALAATSPATFTVAWSGTDATSGIATYDIEVREGSSGTWTPLLTNTTATSTTFTGEQGNRYYFRVRARDQAGNVEAFTATYDVETKIDTVAPIIESFQINRSFVNTSSAEASTTRQVALVLDVSDSQSTMTGIRISQDGTFGPWQPYIFVGPNPEVVGTELLGADGLKTIAVQVRDNAGNVSEVVTDTIRLDTAAGTDYEVSINDGALWTNTLSVTLRIGAPGYTPEMRVSNDGGFAGAPWQPFDTRPSWTLTSFGSFTIPRTVYVRIRNESGQIQGIVQDDIIYDPLPPTGAITITELDANSVTVRLRATDQEQLSGVDEMRVSTDPTFADAEWQDTRVRVTLPRPSGDAVRVYAQWRDRAGNVSAVASDMSATEPVEPTEYRVFLPSIRR